MTGLERAVLQRDRPGDGIHQLSDGRRAGTHTLAPLLVPNDD